MVGGIRSADFAILLRENHCGYSAQCPIFHCRLWEDYSWLSENLVTFPLRSLWVVLFPHTFVHQDSAKDLREGRSSEDTEYLSGCNCAPWPAKCSLLQRDLRNSSRIWVHLFWNDGRWNAVVAIQSVLGHHFLCRGERSCLLTRSPLPWG